MSTERIYYHDSYLTDFQAQVIDSAEEGRRVYLDRTAFYPASGGQPFDVGSLAGVDVIEVVDEGDRIAHVMSAPLKAAQVEGRVDWDRRFDHMQQHTGQHLLSAVLVELFDAMTVSFHLGADSSTIDIETQSLDAKQVERATQRANELVFENRPVTVDFQQASEATDLRKASEREGVLRIVSIEKFDRSACGGTHVRHTGEIGPVLIRKLEKIRNTMRVEFLCGMRAVRRARADYEALAKIARSFSAAVDETPALVAAQLDKLQEADKARRKLAIELAQAQGRELYQSTAADANGIRRVTRRIAKGAIDDELRSIALSFTAGSKAIYAVSIEDPPSMLLAVSKDAGISAGDIVKSAVTAAGGRGGGNPTLAQGSVPKRELLDSAWDAVLARL